MRLNKAKGLLIAVAVCWPLVALSDAFWSGNDLYERCDTDNGQAKLVCTAYIIGATDALTSNGIVCLPKNFTIRQTVDLVVKFLSDHPETRHYTAFSEVAVAMKNFLCKNSN